MNEKSKLFKILSKFTGNELLEFRRFLLSPFFNPNKNVVKLYDIIKKNYPKFLSKSLDKDILYKKIFLKKAKSTRVIDNLLSDLFKQCNLYLIYKNYQQNPDIMELYLLEQYKTKDLRNFIVKNLNRIFRKHDSSILKNSNDNLIKSSIHLFFIDYKLQSAQSPGEKKELLHVLSEMYSYYLLFHHKQLLTLLSRYAMISLIDNNINKPDLFIRNILNELILISDIISHPAKNIISRIALSILNNKNIEYGKMAYELGLIKNSISTAEYFLIHISLTIHFFYEIKEEDHNWCLERFNHVKKLVDQRVIIETIGKFSDFFFTYAVYSALKAGEINWAENFINKYSQFITEETLFNTEKYCLALLLAEKSKLEPAKNNEYCSIAIEHLLNYKPKDITRKINVNELKIRLFYESEQTESLLYNVDSSIHLLNNHKKTLNKLLFECNMNFLKFAKQLVLFKYRRKNANLNILLSKIMMTKNCINKKWLLTNILD